MEIGVVGKYIELQDAYKSVYESITHAGIANDCAVRVQRIDAEDLETEGTDILKTLMVFSSLVDSAIEALKEKFWRHNLLEKTKSRF